MSNLFEEYVNSLPDDPDDEIPFQVPSETDQTYNQVVHIQPRPLNLIIETVDTEDVLDRIALDLQTFLNNHIPELKNAGKDQWNQSNIPNVYVLKVSFRPDDDEEEPTQ